MTREKITTDQIALSCDTIGDQDNGIARHVIDHAINQALNDLASRGEEDGKERVVTLKLTVGLHKGIVYSNLSAQTTLPPMKTDNTAGKFRMKAKGQHELLFQGRNAENPDQGVFIDPDANEE